jgi:hypothetical protein
MDSEFYDTDGFHSTVTNNSRMTIPVGLGGKYLVIGAVTWDTNATGQRICVIFKNGATVGGHTSDMANASYAPRQTCSIVLDLVPGDYVETYVYQDSGGTRTTGGSLDVSNQLTIMRLDSGSSAATLRSYIGYNTVGASYEATSSDKIYAKLVTPSVNCLLESVQAYIKGDGTHASSFGAAVYSDNAGTPGVLIAAASWPTNAGTRQQNAFLSATPRWIGIPMGVELTGGTSYWIAWYGSDGGGGGSGAHNIAYDSGTDKTLATAYVNDASVGSFSAASRSFSIRGLISNTTTINQSQLPGYEYDYVQVTSNASITATTGATASTIVTGSAVTYDGSTTVLIQFVCGLGEPPSGQSMYAVLYDGSTQLGYIARATSPGSSARWPIGGAMRLTPSAGSHTYSIRGFVDSGTGNFYAGSGAAATQPPMFIRITKV